MGVVLLVLKLALLYSIYSIASNAVSVAAEWYWSKRLSGMGSKYNLFLKSDSFLDLFLNTPLRVSLPMPN